MTKLKVNPLEYKNKVIDQLSVAISHVDNIINLNSGLTMKDDFSELNTMKNYINECINIKKDLAELTDFLIMTDNSFKNLSTSISDSVEELPIINILERNPVIKQ